MAVLVWQLKGAREDRQAEARDRKQASDKFQAFIEARNHTLETALGEQTTVLKGIKTQIIRSNTKSDRLAKALQTHHEQTAKAIESFGSICRVEK